MTGHAPGRTIRLQTVIPDGDGHVRCAPGGQLGADLVPGKRYVRLPDPAAEALGFARVIDESGEDYVYPLAQE